MQKYLHLLQIVETEKTVAKQLRQQIEDGEIETERLKSEVTGPSPPTSSIIIQSTQEGTVLLAISDYPVIPIRDL